MSLEAEVREVAKKIPKYRRADANEPETKNGLIRPLFERLGWKFDDLEMIRHEYPVFLDGETKPVDYAYMIDEKVVIFMEAKRIGLDLEVAVEDGTRKAAVEGIPWVIATNGDSIALLMINESISEQERTLFQVTLSSAIRDDKELKRTVNCLQLLTPDSIKSGGLEAFARYELQRKRIRNALEATLGSEDFQNLVSAKYEQLYLGDKPDPELFGQAMNEIIANTGTHRGAVITLEDSPVDEEDLARRREHFFKHPDKDLEALQKTNLTERKPLWVELIAKGKMSSQEMKKYHDFKEKGVSGFTAWLMKHGLARNVGYDKYWKGAVFELYPEVIPDLKKLIGIE